MKLKPDSKVRVKPNKKFEHFKRKIYTVAEIDDKNEYPVLITRNGEYFYFKYNELRLVE